ncbi:MAG: thioredoxin domain-containing protein [Gemmatimonadota bacterium]
MSRGEDRRQARETEQSDMTKFYYLFGAVAVVGLAVVGFNVAGGLFGGAVSAPVELTVESNEELAQLAQGVELGDPDAPVTIIEFGDYQCPGCGAFAMNVKPTIDGTLVESGQAKFVFYDWPIVSIHPNAFLAARAARCSNDQGKYWEYHEALFRNQTRWSTASMPSSAFEDYASELGLDEGSFSSCLNSDRHAEVVTANMELGSRMGVGSTPTVLINAGGQTRRMNSVDFQSIQQAITDMTAAGSN